MNATKISVLSAVLVLFAVFELGFCKNIGIVKREMMGGLLFSVLDCSGSEFPCLCCPAGVCLSSKGCCPYSLTLVRNITSIHTKEFIAALPNGWEDYAWKRSNKGIQLNSCKNNSLCLEKLSLVLPETPPYHPRQFGRCAVIGNSGDLLNTKFGKEIDGYDAVLPIP